MRSLILISALALVLQSCSFGPRRLHAPTMIPWEAAQSLILEGDVRRIERMGEREVRLRLADGRSVRAEEPVAGEAARVYQRCGDPCARTVLK